MVIYYINILLFLWQFDLVCDRGSLGFVSTSVIFAGFIAGSISVSSISDKFGRKLPLFVCGFFCCLFNFVSAFAPAFWVFALFRAIVGFMIGKSHVCFEFNYLTYICVKNECESFVRISKHRNIYESTRMQAKCFYSFQVIVKLDKTQIKARVFDDSNRA